MSKCKCISLNEPEDWQTEPPVVVIPPFTEMKAVSLDACIAEAIQALWAAKIWTQGSCCGHGVTMPSVILAQHVDAKRAHQILGDRVWKVMAWVLTSIPEGKAVLESINSAKADLADYIATQIRGDSEGWIPGEWLERYDALCREEVTPDA